MHATLLASMLELLGDKSMSPFCTKDTTEKSDGAIDNEDRIAKRNNNVLFKNYRI